MFDSVPRRNLREGRRSRRPADERREVYLRATGLVAAAMVLGLALMGWGMSISHVPVGRGLLFAGVGIANLGVLSALIWIVRELDA